MLSIDIHSEIHETLHIDRFVPPIRRIIDDLQVETRVVRNEIAGAIGRVSVDHFSVTREKNDQRVLRFQFLGKRLDPFENRFLGCLGPDQVLGFITILSREHSAQSSRVGLGRGGR